MAKNYIEKKNDHERFDIKEYWIVDSLNESIWINVLDAANKYVLHSYAEEGAAAVSQLFPDFSLPHNSVFEE